MKSQGRARTVWSNGSYPAMATNYLSMGAGLVERANLESDDRVLDVGCGTGTVAISAARRGADVTGIDIAPSMLEEAWKNADVAGQEDVDWREADAAALPFEDDAFDVVLSSLGHMYGDPPADTTRELLRVTRAGGTIGFTAWTPTSLFPELAGTLMTYVSPADLPEFTEPPFMWGDRDVVRARLDSGVDELVFDEETTTYPALSPAHFWDEIATHSGLIGETLDGVTEEDRPALREQMIETVEQYFDDSENAVELTYLRSVATVER